MSEIDDTKIERLKNITKIQCSKGNYDYNEYMRGMANGLILALVIMEDDQSNPEFIHPLPSKRSELLELLRRQ